MRRLALIPMGTPQNAPELHDPDYLPHVGQILTNSTRRSDAETLTTRHPDIRRMYMFDLGYIAVRDAKGGNPRDYWRQWDTEQLNWDPLAAISHQAYVQHGNGITWAQDFITDRHMPGQPQRVVGWCTPDCPRGRRGEADGMTLLQYTATVLREWWSDPFVRRAWHGIHLDGWPRLYAGTLGLADRAPEMEAEFFRHMVPVLTWMRDNGCEVSCTAWGGHPAWPLCEGWATCFKAEDYWVGNGEAWRRSHPDGQWMTYWLSGHATEGHYQGWGLAGDPGSIFQVRPRGRDRDLVAHAVNTFLFRARNDDGGPYFSMTHQQDWTPVNMRTEYPLLWRRLTESVAKGPVEEVQGLVWRRFQHPDRAWRLFRERYHGVRHTDGDKPEPVYQDVVSPFWRRWGRV